MAFTIVIDNDLHFSLLELAAILDLELKSAEHHYKPLFQKLLGENNNDEIIKQLYEIPQYFLRNFSKKSFEPSINLYIHIVNLVNEKSPSLDLFSNLLEYVDPNSSKNKNLTKLDIPYDIIIIALTNIFNSVPTTSILRFDALYSLVDIIVKENVSGTIQNVAKNIIEWVTLITDSINPTKVADLFTAIFNQYALEDEKCAVNFFANVIINKPTLLNSNSLINFFTKILNSTTIYDISKYQSIFSLIEDASFVNLLKLYLAGDNQTYITSKSEFSSNSQINFDNLDSSFQSLAILNYLASSSGSASIPYDVISKETGVPLDVLELKLITLISEGFIIGKLSQSTNSVILNSINYSSPSLSSNSNLVNWNEIGTLLNSWNENITNLHSIVQTLIVKRGKRVNAPPVVMAFHQQKLEAKEAREKKSQQTETSNENDDIVTAEATAAQVEIDA